MKSSQQRREGPRTIGEVREPSLCGFVEVNEVDAAPREDAAKHVQ